MKDAGPNVLRACYDLEKCPPTYDVVSFLAHVELERLRRKVTDVWLFIAPGSRNGFRHDSVWPRSIDERIALRDNLLIPVCHLLPSAHAVVRLDVRSSIPKDAFGVNQRLISLPFIVKALSQGCRPLSVHGAVIKSPRLITFTLREAKHHAPRNSNVGEWVIAASELRRRGFDVVFVRDTIRAHEPIPGHTIDPEAASDVGARARLYSRALLNVGVNNGPMWLAIFMDVPVLMLRPTTQIGGCYDDAFYRKCGVPRGSQLPTSPTYQRLLWEDDLAINIVAGVVQMTET